jgi:hypothetical protein
VDVHCLVRVAAKNALNPAQLCIMQRARRNLSGQAQEPRVQLVQQPRYRFRARFDFLQLFIDPDPDLADLQVAAYPFVELVAMNCEVSLSLAPPHVTLVYRHTHQVRHYVRKPVVVVPLDPHDFNLSFWVGELADVGEKSPVFAREAAEIQVRENVAQQNQPSILDRLQNLKRFPGTAYLRPEVNV